MEARFLTIIAEWLENMQWECRLQKSSRSGWVHRTIFPVAYQVFSGATKTITCDMFFLPFDDNGHETLGSFSSGGLKNPQSVAWHKTRHRKFSLGPLEKTWYTSPKIV